MDKSTERIVSWNPETNSKLGTYVHTEGVFQTEAKWTLNLESLRKLSYRYMDGGVDSSLSWCVATPPSPHLSPPPRLCRWI